MTERCGTCRRWQPGLSIHGIMLAGTCGLDGKERKGDEMKGCFGWKEASGEQMESRKRAGLKEARDVIVSFNTTTHALKAAKLLPAGKVIPTPRKISASCGLSLQIDGDQEVILSTLKDAGIEWSFAGEM